MPSPGVRPARKPEPVTQLVRTIGWQLRGHGLQLRPPESVNRSGGAGELEGVPRRRGEVQIPPVEDLVGQVTREAREPETPEHRCDPDLHARERQALSLLRHEHVADAHEAVPIEREHLSIENVASQVQEVARHRGAVDDHDLISRDTDQRAGTRSVAIAFEASCDDRGMRGLEGHAKVFELAESIAGPIERRPPEQSRQPKHGASLCTCSARQGRLGRG